MHFSDVSNCIKKPNYFYLIIGLLIPVLLSGCATSSLFTPYPVQIAEIKRDVEALKFSKPLKTLDKKRKSKDKTLYMLERGRISQLQGNADVSIKDFELAIRAEASADEKAKISASDTLAKGAALVSNDNAIPYRAASYERVMMHHYQAINYLMINDVEGAGVEVRRAALEQRDALERHHKALAKAEKQAREKKYDPAADNALINQRFAAMYASAGDIKNSFQNAYTFYLSGLIYELIGEPNDAYIDYKKALEIFPENPVLQDDVLRLSRRLGFQEEYAIFSGKFKRKPESVKAGEGELVVLYEEGYVPVKEDVGIPLHTIKNLHVVAFPVYRDLSRHKGELRLSGENGTIGKTSLICDFRALAVKDLEEKMPGIIIRQVLRLIAKNSVRKTAEDQLGAAGAIAAIVFNVVSEQADRRSWLMLPRNAQILRVRLPVGTQILTVSAGNGEQNDITVNIQKDKLSILRVIGTRKQLFTHVL